MTRSIRTLTIGLAAASCGPQTVVFELSEAGTSETSSESDEGPGSVNPPGAGCAAPLEFADPAVEQAVRQAIGIPTGDIHADDVWRLESLVVRDDSVSSLAGVECLTDLVGLDVGAEGSSSDPWQALLTDVSPLRRLHRLEHVSLSFSSVADLTPLVDLPRLAHLNAVGTAVSDLTPVRSMLALTHAELDFTDVVDLEPLVGHPTLANLSLWVTEVRDLTPLRELPALQSIGLCGVPVDDITPLGDVPGLEHVDICATQVADVEPLTQLPLLREVMALQAPLDCDDQAENIALIERTVAANDGWFSHDCD